MSNATAIDNVTDTSTLGDKTTVHEAAVAEIVGMIRAKYEDEGIRNFAIGKRAFEHAQWQKGNFPGAYLNGDFDTLMNRIRDDVRMWVPIKAESIRIAHWVRCHVMRECVRKAAGDTVADCLTLYECMTIVGKALHFTVADLEGSLNECWLDMIKGVAAERSAGGTVRREDFENRIVATENTVKAAKLSALDPDKAAAKLASDNVKAKAAAVAKTVKDITSAVDTGIASGAIKPEGALAILEGVAKQHGKPLVAASVGFDPATCTVADCETLASAMFAAGKLAEMRALVSKLSKGIAAIEKATADSAKPAPVKNSAKPAPVKAAA